MGRSHPTSDPTKESCHGQFNNLWIDPLNSHLLTHNPISVWVAHIRIGGVVAADGGDVVAAGFGAGDAAVVVVVVEVQGMAFGLGGCVLVGFGGRGR